MGRPVRELRKVTGWTCSRRSSKPASKNIFPSTRPTRSRGFASGSIGRDSDQRALVRVIGSRTRVYEVMQRKRALSLAMIRRLHERFDIPANVLIRPVCARRRAA